MKRGLRYIALTCPHKSSRVEVGQTTHIDDKGKGVVAGVDGTSFVAEGALPGDRVAIVAPRSRRKRRAKRAQVERVLLSSWHRMAPFCSHYATCGGCALQHLSYEEQLLLKQGAVARLLAPYVREGEAQPAILAAPRRVYYRNRVDYTFGAARWFEKHEAMLPVDADRRGAGFHVKGFYDKVVHVEHCFLHESNALRKTVHQWALEHGVPYYNSRTHEGLLRLMTVRTTLSQETMVVLHFAYESEHIAALCKALVAAHPQVTSLYSVLNPSYNDSAPNVEYTLMHGSAAITEQCGSLRLRLYPQVFYQTNSEQAQRLYEVIGAYADVHADETVLDLYCGIGSIGLFVAHAARRVVGVDIVPQSIEAARENARYNNIGNAHFFALSSEDAVVAR